jgi:hypothetical protein
MDFLEETKKTTLVNAKGYRKLGNIQKQLYLAWQKMLCNIPPPTGVYFDYKNTFYSIEDLIQLRQSIISLRCEVEWEKACEYMEKSYNLKGCIDTVSDLKG